MSNELEDRLREYEGSDALGNGDFSLIIEAADTLKRYREALEQRDRFIVDAGLWQQFLDILPLQEPTNDQP
ncbi:hypothetical protein [Stakelama pacifica]|uniref:Uncharacterized protein n=1 Tax=Stakelama pacifica TaxID=517720 RepID=A0A4R6F9J9_9SPHN|nr:hypothetical protein [Stakelama pacifica]TDN77746.1 hypothetical protein EV664_1269 [Stakelama pacifica]GGP00880.1 hypothetical protein GCM10011329_37780 [Stakelama pacifica]